jgi:hypothetical protein
MSISSETASCSMDDVLEAKPKCWIIQVGLFWYSSSSADPLNPYTSTIIDNSTYVQAVKDAEDHADVESSLDWPWATPILNVLTLSYARAFSLRHLSYQRITDSCPGFSTSQVLVVHSSYSTALIIPHTLRASRNVYMPLPLLSAV